MKIFVGVLLVMILTMSVVHADVNDKWSFSAIAAPNDGVAMGAAISYNAFDHLWGDLGVRKNEGTSAGFIGLSTDLQYIGRAVLSVFDINVGDFSNAYRIGAGKTLSFDNDGIFAYFAYGVSF